MLTSGADGPNGAFSLSLSVSLSVSDLSRPVNMASPTKEQVDQVEADFKQVQDEICAFLASAGAKAFREDAWDYHKGVGGGRTRVWEVERVQADNTLQPDPTNMPIWEKGACNFSGIQGSDLPPSAVQAWKLPENCPYRATGVSLIIHPSNPWVPTIHMNIRFFICGDRWWFGGGVDLTPYYPILSQVVEFHRLLRELCEEHGVSYDTLKQRCDEYFWLAHRNESRGIGGLFWDSMSDDFEKNKAFAIGLGRLFIKLYGLFVENQRLPYTQAQREFQLYRRGRYVEFNLIYDRGTQFGLKSNGRTESILVSLPATVHYQYDYTPRPGTPEGYLYAHFLKFQDWLNLDQADQEAMSPPPNYCPAPAASIQTRPSSGAKCPFSTCPCPCPCASAAGSNRFGCHARIASHAITAGVVLALGAAFYHKFLRQ
ncbi:uncharacterized protein MONBRDRAFT_28565 [Monosiga brevicollis MX1]|uniref:coproporphyrinogen oxidase n=1 Tax=Monosiga brevicollis TaxID=81824 RepID=A9V8J6_MONBE|nr:uncharacterized protein MONBRDRAFT_28565 [Monosiga brevicollis MX1]EDQ86155.1 predicted protein [Monosiga brevicollis MX1]|eukprot:XP_001749080.1 hypothetical protein [Monosiga brevicollis MX1]